MTKAIWDILYTVDQISLVDPWYSVLKRDQKVWSKNMNRLISKIQPFWQINADERTDGEKMWLLKIPLAVAR